MYHFFAKNDRSDDDDEGLNLVENEAQKALF